MPFGIQNRLRRNSSNEDTKKKKYKSTLSEEAHQVGFKIWGKTIRKEDIMLFVSIQTLTSLFVKTNIGKMFFTLLEKHFPKMVGIKQIV